LTNEKQQRKLANFCIFFSEFFKTETLNHYPINIYYIPDPDLGNKTISNPYEPLSKKDINSGICWDNNILVYRKEEAPKVIIHELIHVYKIDQGIPPTTQYSFLKSSVEIRFKETYTELLSALLFTEMRYKNDRERAMIRLFNKFFQQADKVMCIYWNNGVFVQDTHVFEYIVAKAALCAFYNDKQSKLLELFDAPKSEFIKTLNLAIQKYLSNFRCDLKSLP
jgi:hypothetical protein